MPDAHYAEPRLAAIYDAIDGGRRDLAAYVTLVAQFGARSVLDIGCGTGTLACLLASQGIEVTAIDPAEASVAVARSKPQAEMVRWLVTDSTALPTLAVDMVTMTGNVAQVFLTDEEWAKTLRSARDSLHPKGRLIFETRDPSMKAWQQWTPERTQRHFDIPEAGAVEIQRELRDVNPPFVSFRTTYVFASDGATFVSESTLRFRTKQEVEASLQATGFSVEDIRDAPDRPGQEFVFIARLKPSHASH